MKKILPYLIIYSMMITGLAIANFAQGQIVNLPDPLRCNGGDCDIIGIIKKVTEALKILVIPIGTIMIIIGGLMYMLSGGNEEKIKKAKHTLLYAVIGIAIVLSVDFIVDLIREILAKAT